MNYKKYIAAVMALSMATGVAGCGSSSNSSSKAEDDFSATENVAVADTESIDAIPEGAEKEILYLGEATLTLLRAVLRRAQSFSFLRARAER